MSKPLLFGRTKLLAVLLMVLLLPGCMTLGGGAAQSDQPRANPWASQPPYEWPPYQQSDASDLALGAAPQGLLSEADSHYESSRASETAASLERALRLAPRSPVVWYRLATLRAAQGDYAAANRLSEKAYSLLNENSSPRIRQWLDWLNQWLLQQLRPDAA